MSTRMDALIKARREALGDRSMPQDASRKWGLALSGGGIRSATFCLGLIRSLARHGTLLRFDMLSTVSGGGYIGATVGSLFSRAETSQEAVRVQDALGDRDGAWFLWWLRANGRYLIPSGIKDTVFVFAMFLRNLVGVHFELGLLALLSGIVLTAINLIGWAIVAQIGFLDSEGSYFDMLRWLPPWLPVVWLLLPVFAVAGAVYAAAYWAQPWIQNVHTFALGCVWMGVLAAGAAFGWMFWRYGLGSSPVGDTVRVTLWLSVTGVIAVWLVAALLARRYVHKLRGSMPQDMNAAEAHSLLGAEVRNLLTRGLAFCLKALGVVLVVGLVDRAAWILAFQRGGLVDTGAILVVAAAILRASLPVLFSASKRHGGLRFVLLAGQGLGYLLTFMLCAWWVSIVYKAAIGASFLPTEFQYGNAVAVLALLTVPVLAYLMLTGRNFAFLNQSSLHAYYKARLTRSYLGATNEKRFRQDGLLGCLAKVPNVLLAGVASKRIDDVIPGDDMTLEKYLPQRSGGPIHMINVCVNQTQDPRGGLFNRDRLGLPMTVISGGWMNAAQKGWRRLRGRGQLSLGTWMAISGAVVSPGLGNRTRTGLSALTMFAGVRVGYWWSLAERLNWARADGKSRRVPLFAKSLGLLDELGGVFKGTKGADWLLTDGGHFENTGAYALLAERASVIVLADCGADPLYAFGDLENLVRKARIDLRAEILFQRPKQQNQPFGFGSLNDLASSTGNACLALARIIYDGDPGQTGILIIVKPNLCDGLPVDLVNFKAQNPDFPQQTTADQFFSEAQWESYFHLGHFMGRNLTPSFIRGLVRDSAAQFEADECSPLEVEKTAGRQIAESNKGAANSRVPARIAATAVGATIGLGAAATIGVSVWQFVENARGEMARKEVDERNALKQLAELWQELPPRQANGAASPASPQAYGALAAALLRVSDTLCPGDNAGWFLKSPLAQRISEDGLHGCQALDWMQRTESCHVLVETANRRIPNAIPNCVLPEGRPKEAQPRYWIYDYGRKANVDEMHPCDPMRRDSARERQIQIAMHGPLTKNYPSKIDVELTPEAAAIAAAEGCEFRRRGDEVIASAAVTVREASSRSTSTPAPAPLPLPLPLPSESVFSEECKGITVYMQIYGGSQRDEVRRYREAWRKLGANVPPIEDVIATAERAGRAGPKPVSQTTVRFHDEAASKCARSLQAAALDAGALSGAAKAEAWKVEPLSARFTPGRRTIEVWIAPRMPGNGSSG